jgi:hypothetical protein
MMKFVRLLGVTVTATAAATLVACGGDKTPATPTTPTTSASIAAPAIKSPASGAQLDTLRPTVEVTNAVIAGTAGAITYRFEVSETDGFPAGSRTFAMEGVAQGSGSTSVTVGPSDLIPNATYYWRARATNGTMTSVWSPVETFKTKSGGFRDGQTVFDPLTDGQSVGAIHGGRFIPGEGWQSTSQTDGIDYDIPTCSSCRVEFDVTNFGRKEGESVSKDLKWLSMADAGSFGNFNAFRDNPWKMHLEQRSDGDGTGMKLIWRNGDSGGGDPGDHTQRNDSTVNWSSSSVYHFVFEWTQNHFSVSVDGNIWFQDGLASPYAPPNHRVSIGCYPRAESFNGAIFRNFSITPQ